MEMLQHMNQSAALPSHGGGETEKEEEKRASGVANTKKSQQGGDSASCTSCSVMYTEGTERGSPRQKTSGGVTSELSARGMT